ncbi:MAG: excinuclease ABC subunit B [Boseongicola sp.]|nr:excinuclease ABC subunit B [Boseongicola sp.]
MRTAFIASLIVASPAYAWDVSAEGPLCRLFHDMEEASVDVTFDPRSNQPYSMVLEKNGDPWESAPVFAIRFDGLGPLTISTQRHKLLDEGKKLTVSDRGFENVLKGIAFNQMAVAMLGDQQLVIPLIGAAPAVEQFRNCVVSPSA